MALQFDDDSIRVISFAADHLTITTKPYEASKLLILNCEKIRKTKRLQQNGKTPLTDHHGF